MNGKTILLLHALSTNVLADYSAPDCWTCFDDGNGGNAPGLKTDDCNSAIAQLCNWDGLGSVGAGGTSFSQGTCGIEYVPTPDLLRVGSPQDCFNTYNNIMSSCGAPPPGGSNGGFGGQIGFIPALDANGNRPHEDEPVFALYPQKEGLKAICGNQPPDHPPPESGIHSEGDADLIGQAASRAGTAALQAVGGEGGHPPKARREVLFEA